MPAVQVDIWRGLIAVFLIMTLMNDVYRVSGGLDSTTSRGPEFGPTWRVANPIKGKSNLSPDSSLSLSLPFPLLTSVETDLSPTPMAIPIVVHAYRVLV